MSEPECDCACSSWHWAERKKLEAERDALRARVEKFEKALKEIENGGHTIEFAEPQSRVRICDAKNIAKAALDEDGGKK